MRSSQTGGVKVVGLPGPSCSSLATSEGWVFMCHSDEGSEAHGVKGLMQAYAV